MKQGWSVTLHERVKRFIGEQERVAQHRMEKDRQKLALQGTRACEPLVKHLEDDVWYLRSKCSHGLFRLFYYRDGEKSFYIFDAHKKKERKIKKHVREAVMRRRAELKEEEA